MCLSRQHGIYTALCISASFQGLPSRHQAAKQECKEPSMSPAVLSHLRLCAANKRERRRVPLYRLTRGWPRFSAAVRHVFAGRRTATHLPVSNRTEDGPHSFPSTGGCLSSTADMRTPVAQVCSRPRILSHSCSNVNRHSSENPCSAVRSPAMSEHISAFDIPYGSMLTGTTSSAILFKTAGEHHLTVVSTPNFFSGINSSDKYSSDAAEVPQQVARFKLHGARHFRSQSFWCSAEIRA
ncbi:unnamed protein product [Rangifer tarandus platyrhynchus]|uniref:Uncharacterized protein n=1 Tax=Rangifer tarandus platyrhynchus TaxID=3082113 RepID=A0ABN8XKT6_RANTA|nr:unnamed protein product [Rangifer tarandus platyrhynchus]